MIDIDELIKSWEIFRDKMISALTGKGKEIMLDRNKVIKGLDHCDFGSSGTCYEKECPYYQSNDCTEELKNDTLALLKEQEEVKPICQIIFDVPYYFCENCKAMLNMYATKANYCSKCGKKIKWQLGKLYGSSATKEILEEIDRRCT